MAGAYTGDLRGLIERCNSHHRSYLLTRKFDDLQEVIRCAQHGFLTTPTVGPPRPFFEWILGKSLARRFLHTRQTEDITKAIEMSGMALTQMTPNYPYRQTCVNYLIFSILLRDNELEGSVDLDDLHLRIPPFNRLPLSLTIRSKSGEDEEVFEVFENFLTDVDDFRVPTSSTSAVRLKIETLNPKMGEDDEVFSYFVVTSHGVRLPREATLEELDSDIVLQRHALKAFSTPRPDPLRIWTIRFHLGALLSRRHLLQRVLEENDEAITCFTLALDLDVPISAEDLAPVLALCHYFLSQGLLIRHIAFGKREDLDKAVEYAKQATAGCHSHFVSFAGRLSSLAMCMGRRFLVTGELKDLDAAIETGLHAVNVAERDGIDIYVPIVSRSLAESLALRSQLTGQSKESKHAIEIQERAMDSMPPDNPRRVLHLLNLGLEETSLGQRQGDVSYLERGFQHVREALSAVTDDFEKYFKSDPTLFYDFQLKKGQVLLGKRMFREALDIARTLSREFPHMPHARAISRLLRDSLLTQWEGMHDEEVLDEAILAAHRSLELESRVNALIMAQETLGKCLYHRYKSRGNPQDLKNALEVLLAGFHTSAGAPSIRISLGQMAITILCDVRHHVPDWDQARDLSIQIIDLIAIESSRSLDAMDKQDWLPDKLYQVSTYASIALQAGSDVLDVVDMLETCRGSILGHMLDNQTDLHELMQVAPGTAQLFAALRDENNSEINLSGSMNVRVEEMSRRGAAEVELRACLADIRKLEGFDRFLLGPTWSDIKAAAAHGPILIINAQPFGAMPSLSRRTGAISCLCLSWSTRKWENFKEQGLWTTTSQIFTRRTGNIWDY